MRIIQIVPSLSYGDAIGNNILAIDKMLKKAGYNSEIYAENIDGRLPKNVAKKIKRLNGVQREDVVIYHFSIGAQMTYIFAELRCRKIVLYHNITPKKFFERYSFDSWKMCQDGEQQRKFLSDKVDYCLAVSEYNKRDLIKDGFKCKIDVLPILIKFSDYKNTPADHIIKKYNDGYTNILFTGRISPNKCQQDVINTFYHYKKYYNDKSRLFIVGNDSGMEKYSQELMGYTERLRLTNDVVFTGHVKFDEILAYYQVADLFLCMSEHEGFCVPLAEAMYFELPIVAYDSSAVAETMGDGGFVLKDKNPLEAAGVIDYILTHEETKKKILKKQEDRLLDFDESKIEKSLLGYIENFLERKDENT